MRHSAPQRIAAGFLAVLYLLGGAEHWLGIDPCPHHDAAFFEAGIVDAEHAAHHAHQGSSDSNESDAGHDGPCACIGPCTTSSPTAVPSATTHAIAAAFERVQSAPASAGDFVAPQFVPYLLPYAHAPPFLG
jgi:hypothetical protein